jgi:hypothetical protein
VRSDVSVYLSNAKAGANNSVTIADLNFNFSNGIVYGNLQSENEIEADSVAGAAFNWKFENCVLKLNNENINPNNTSHFVANVLNQEPLFKNAQAQDYVLLSGSPAINAGSAAIANQNPPIPEDILGNNRLMDAAPDCGAFEYVP